MAISFLLPAIRSESPSGTASRSARACSIGSGWTARGRAAEWIRQHVKAGDKLRLRFDFYLNPLPVGTPRGVLESRAGFRGRPASPVWSDVEQAVGGGPWLVKDGKPAVDGV